MGVGFIVKKNIVIIFGGKSFEHEVSIKSAKSIMNAINKDKYEIKLVYIDKLGDWYLCNDINKLDNLVPIKDIKIFENCDCVFPVLHGNNGEDGKIQGLFDMVNVPYVGCNLISSALCMDKVFTKIILNNENINQTKYISIMENDYKIDNIKKEIRENIGYPCFIKPANAGSSVGINKIYHEHELEKNIAEALKYDKKILIEECIYGREVEIGVLGNNKVITSKVGEVIPGDDFYSYDAKYNSKESIVKIPASISDSLFEEIKNTAIKAYKVLECSSLSRIDFFIQNETNKIYLNEINTLPGFTNISMYPVLFENIGIKYDILIDKLIELGIENHNKKVI